LPDLAVVDLPHVASGKVREIYRAGDDLLLLVASDRMSAFDVVLPTPIPDKGRVLTGLSLFWFARTGHIVPNHVVSGHVRDLPFAAGAELAGRSLLVQRLDMLPLECVVRGYLAGSGWKDYRATGSLCGHRLPTGLRQGERLPEPLFTPSTKAGVGEHDQNIGAEQGRDLVGGERYDELQRVSLALYRHAAAHAAGRGILLADTKFELGLDAGGRLVLGDEALTPDSSRYWPADGYAPGGSPPSFDKQYVRDWLERQPWDKRPPGPALPDDVVAGTAARYREAYERLTGARFAGYLEQQGVRG
jgi:phosphoribosylaminoimidazole-succinocarboxamide synthase